MALSSVAQSFDYDLASLKMYSRQIKEGALIIITISPISFSQEKADQENSLQYNYYNNRLSPFVIPNLKIEDYLQNQIVPFFRAGFLWREKYANEMAEKALTSFADQWVTQKSDTEESAPLTNSPQNVTTKKADTVSGAVTIDYTFNVRGIQIELTSLPTTSSSQLIESVNFMFNKWYFSGGFGNQYFAVNRKDLEKLIAYCLQKKWRPVLITIPVSQALLDGLEPNYMQTYVYDNLAKTNLRGAPLFDLSANVQLTQNTKLFSNSDHLNRTGSVIFSYLLLQRLIDEGYVSKNVDGYDY
ncbi:TPA: hypothetical protein DIV55_06790 [Patescibacteria group bacterium]|nr:hypothetical protein [Patescibacteria group bacterium]